MNAISSSLSFDVFVLQFFFCRRERAIALLANVWLALPSVFEVSGVEQIHSGVSARARARFHVRTHPIRVQLGPNCPDGPKNSEKTDQIREKWRLKERKSPVAANIWEGRQEGGGWTQVMTRHRWTSGQSEETPGERSEQRWRPKF